MSGTKIGQKMAVLTIANGDTKSNGIYCGNAPPRAIIMPTAFEGTVLALQGAVGDTAPADADYLPLFDSDGAALTMVVAPGRYVVFYADALMGLAWLRVVAGTAQTGPRTLTLVLGA